MFSRMYVVSRESKKYQYVLQCTLKLVLLKINFSYKVQMVLAIIQYIICPKTLKNNTINP